MLPCLPPQPFPRACVLVQFECFIGRGDCQVRALVSASKDEPSDRRTREALPVRLRLNRSLCASAFPKVSAVYSMLARAFQSSNAPEHGRSCPANDCPSSIPGELGSNLIEMIRCRPKPSGCIDRPRQGSWQSWQCAQEKARKRHCVRGRGRHHPASGTSPMLASLVFPPWHPILRTLKLAAKCVGAAPASFW
jgi:hypothetical protein